MYVYFILVFDIIFLSSDSNPFLLSFLGFVGRRSTGVCGGNSNGPVDSRDGDSSGDRFRFEQLRGGDDAVVGSQLLCWLEGGLALGYLGVASGSLS